MILKPSNYQDIDRYFRNTFVKFDGFGDRLFYITTVNRTEISGYDDENTDFVLSLHEEAPFILNYVLPHKAVFQLGKKVAMLQRIPARQYKRGVCEENTSIRHCSGDSLDVNMANLKKFVCKPNYRSLRVALHGKTSDLEVAITPRFWFRRGSQALFLDQTHIGQYNRESRKLTVNRHFKQDIQRLVENDLFEVKVES